MKHSTVKIYSQDFRGGDDLVPRPNFFTADWGLPRLYRATYTTPLAGEDAAEQAFHIFNAPREYLDGYELEILKASSGPSLSVGDIVVVVDDAEYLCGSSGWEKRPV